MDNTVFYFSTPENYEYLDYNMRTSAEKLIRKKPSGVTTTSDENSDKIARSFVDSFLNAQSASSRNYGLYIVANGSLDSALFNRVVVEGDAATKLTKHIPFEVRSSKYPTLRVAGVLTAPVIICGSDIERDLLAAILKEGPVKDSSIEITTDTYSVAFTVFGTPTSVFRDLYNQFWQLCDENSCYENLSFFERVEAVVIPAVVSGTRKSYNKKEKNKPRPGLLAAALVSEEDVSPDLLPHHDSDVLDYIEPPEEEDDDITLSTPLPSKKSMPTGNAIDPAVDKATWLTNYFISTADDNMPARDTELPY